MNDDTRWTPPPTDPTPASDSLFATETGPAAETPSVPPAAAFTGRTPHKTEAVRAGMIVGTGLLVALGAAVAMGASPAPSGSTGAAPSQVAPGNGNGRGGPGFEGFGGFGPFGAGLPGDLGKGLGRGGPGERLGQGFGKITVTKVDGPNLSLATEDGWTRTIAVTDAATVTKGGAAATLADVAVGDEIRFRETRNADGTYTIQAIAIVQPQVAGTVTAVDADSITITLRDGTSQTIHTNGSTAYHLERADGKHSDVTVGSVVVAAGDKASDGTLTASSVWVQLPHVGGTVGAVTGDTITVTQRDGSTVTIHVGSGTTYRVAGVATATIADVKTGMRIVVEGTKRADGSIDATAVGAGNLGKGRGHDGAPGADPKASPAPDASGSTTG
jgi:hypothetical protein